MRLTRDVDSSEERYGLRELRARPRCAPHVHPVSTAGTLGSCLSSAIPNWVYIALNLSTPLVTLSKISSLSIQVCSVVK